MSDRAKTAPSNKVPARSKESAPVVFDRETFLDRVAQVHHTKKNENAKSFIVRAVELRFREAVRRADQFIIALHGASKQGKSSIIRNTFTNAAEYYFVPIGASLEPEALYRNLLAKAGANIAASGEVSGRISYTVKIPILGNFTGAGGGSRQYQTITGDMSDADWVAQLLMRTSNARIIILDNFHHVDKETQRALARDFTVLGAHGFKVVIAGTWPQEDYLNDLSTDLSGHYLSFSVEPWTKEELNAVVAKGAEELGLRLEGGTLRKLVNHARGSVYVLHRLMRRFYETADMASVAKGGPVRSSASDAAWDNFVVQPVGVELARDITGKLREAVDFGRRDLNGRTNASYILEAMLSSRYEKFESGFSLKELFDQTCETMKRRGKSDIFDFNSFSSIVKASWIEHQRKKLSTPIVFFDDRKERVAIYDAHALFAIRMNAYTIRSALI